MNRHERRKAAAQARTVIGSDKAKVTLHTAPEDSTPEHLAAFLALASQAFTLGLKLPGATFPIHVVVEWDNKRCCGTIEPSDGAGELVFNKSMH